MEKKLLDALLLFVCINTGYVIDPGRHVIIIYRIVQSRKYNNQIPFVPPPGIHEPLEETAVHDTIIQCNVIFIIPRHRSVFSGVSRSGDLPLKNVHDKIRVQKKKLYINRSSALTISFGEAPLAGHPRQGTPLKLRFAKLPREKACTLCRRRHYVVGRVNLRDFCFCHFKFKFQGRHATDRINIVITGHAIVIIL